MIKEKINVYFIYDIGLLILSTSKIDITNPIKILPNINVKLKRFPLSSSTSFISVSISPHWNNIKNTNELNIRKRSK